MQPMETLLAVLLTVPILAQVILVGYLLFLTVSALAARPISPRRAAARRRFAVLVPAHNEQAVIGRLLSSLNQLDYPRAQFDVCVVADNCDDATASIARSNGARVYERHDSAEKAKGFALRWLIQQLAAEGRAYEAFVVIDADSVVAPNFLACMDARLDGGAKVIQAYYSVLNSDQSALAGLRYAALAAVHYLRPLGRAAFGLSCGLKGNGMCFSAEIIERFEWQWFTLAEDVEFHLALVDHGIAVQFAPETWVKADMPVTLNQATSQNVRWERGRLQLVRQHVPRLLMSGLRQGSWVKLDAAAEQLIPPLSMPLAVCATLAPIAWLTGNPGLAILALGCLGAYVVYITMALVLVRAPLGIYLALGMAPVYVAWKVGVYFRSVVGARTTAWIRTSRAPTATTSG
jgi:1,2-diacylglycerol 3-beta-glucosyltransferase